MTTINILTLFPEFFTGPLNSALLEKAQARGILKVNLVNPRDYAADRHQSVDDRPYGGGPGMVMSLPPLAAALESLPERGLIAMLSPSGQPFEQKIAERWAKKDVLTFICGRYEGIDARLMDVFPLESVSVGDFVLCGGESGVLCILEAVARLKPGFMGHADSGTEESFSSGLLEYFHYTRPEDFRGLMVPEVLVGGNHAYVDRWRREKSLEITLQNRPELLQNAALSAADVEYLRSKPRFRLGRNLFAALVHGPVLNRIGEIVTVSLTNLDIHDIARVCRSYGMGAYYLVTPLIDQQELGKTLLDHWTEGPGLGSHPDRAEALRLVKLKDDLNAVLTDIETEKGSKPFILATSAKYRNKDAKSITLPEVREKLKRGPVLVLLGTGYGLSKEILSLADAFLQPIRPFDVYNHLPVRAAAAITIDRILGDVD